MKKQRKHYTPEEKVAILRRHLLEQVPISELCDKQGLQPTVFYRWQKEFFENGAAAFQPKARPNHSTEQERISWEYNQFWNIRGAVDEDSLVPFWRRFAPGAVCHGGVDE
jgi:transposase